MEKSNIKRMSFVFYESFQSAIARLNEPELQLIMYKAISDYGFCMIEPNFDSQPTDKKMCLDIMWDLIKPQLDANWKRFTNGCKGGSPKGSGIGNQNARKKNEPKTNQERTKNEPKTNQKQTKNEPNVNDNVNVNVNVNVNDNVVLDSNDVAETTNQEQEFVKGMKNNYPNVSGMKQPLTLAEYDKLLTDGYTAEQIKATLLKMENLVDLKKKYMSANLTLRNWLK